MTTIDINAQQIVVDALAKNPKNNQKQVERGAWNVLEHTGQTARTLYEWA